MEPLFFEPIYKETVWGGEGLKIYGRDLPSEHTGESWEIASHNNGTSIITDGKFKGALLSELVKEYKVELLGQRFHDIPKFPLLVKIIDANDKLSVQVHPNDEYAMTNENGELGKTEMWYILQAKEGAKLVLGTKKGVTKEQFKEAALDGTLEKYIDELEVKAGDVINIPAGMLHAIGDGIMLAEVQQNSDTTYRVYDWNRVGLDGKPRELHIDKALDVIDFKGELSTKKVEGVKVEMNESSLTYYIANEYFAVELLELKGEWLDNTENIIFYLYTCIEGDGIIDSKEGSFQFKSGQSFMIPASLGEFRLKGNGKLLRSYVPDKEKYIDNLHRNSGFTINEIVYKVDVSF